MPIFDYVHPQIFWSTLIYVNLYQHAQNQAISLICCGDMADWKILQSETNIFPYMEQTFSQTWDFCRNTADNISFHYRTNSVKINDQIFQ